MSFSTKCKQFFARIFNFNSPAITLESRAYDIAKRIDRLERNYIILLKRVLEIDGIKLVSNAGAFSHKVMATPNDEFNKGLNEPEPTIH